MKMRILFTFTLALLILIPAARIQAAGIDDYNVAWNTPSDGAAGSMPLGNGDIALNVWVEKSGDLVFYIAKSDAWSGDISSPGYGVYGLIKVGRVRVSLSPNPFADARAFKQQLVLRDGSIVVSNDDGPRQAKLRVWVDANRPVIRVDATCSTPVQITATLESWRAQATPYLGVDTIIKGSTVRVAWYYKGLNKDVPELVDRMIGAAMTGNALANSSDTALQSGAPATAHHLEIHPLTAQCPTEDQYLARLDQQITRTNAVPAEQAWTEHCKWWSQFWDRSHIYISGGDKAREVTLGYVLQRFKNACTSRGPYPMKFNGSLFNVDNPAPAVVKNKDRTKPDTILPVTADYRAWGHQYWFQNTRPMYWPMMASGDFDLMHPFFRMYGEQLKVNARQVREHYNHGGAYFRETGPFWGGIPKLSPEESGGYTKHYYTPVLELSAMMLDYFTYTQDKGFARETLIPIADAGVTFFEQHFPRDSQGKLFVSPANAIEMYWKVNNPTPDIAGLHFVLRGLLSLPEDLGDIAQRQHWRKVLAELPPIPVGQRNGKEVILPHADPPAGRHNSENPELYAIYPFRIYGLGKPDLELARATFAARQFKNKGCWHQDAVQAAYLGDSATAREFVTAHLTRKDRRMRFDAFWDKGHDYTPDEDNGGNGLHALQTMLVQFDDSKIRLLPAWPKSWNADFKLRAPLQTTIEGRVESGRLIDLKVTPPGRLKDIEVTDLH